MRAAHPTCGRSRTTQEATLSALGRYATYACAAAGRARIAEACASLEAERSRPSWPRDLLLLDGSWRLLYSSSLAAFPPRAALPSGLARSLLTPPPLADGPLDALRSALDGSPLGPRDVVQRIDVRGRRITNCVSVGTLSGALGPLGPAVGGAIGALGNALGNLGAPLGPLGAAAASPDARLNLELDHQFTVDGEGGGRRAMAAAGSVVELSLEHVSWRLDGAEAAAEPVDGRYALPSALVPFASGKFDTTVIDGVVRISRDVTGGTSADDAELRIFVRDGPPPAGADGATWQEEEDARTAAAEAARARGGAEDESGPVVDRWQEGGFGDYIEDDVPD